VLKFSARERAGQEKSPGRNLLGLLLCQAVESIELPLFLQHAKETARPVGGFFFP
jgi:hypothetical protein